MTLTCTTLDRVLAPCDLLQGTVLGRDFEPVCQLADPSFSVPCFAVRVHEGTVYIGPRTERRASA